MAGNTGPHLRCPECGKKGVTHRMTGSEDHWGCRYCDWYAFSYGEDAPDRKERRRLADVNPDRDVWVTDLSVDVWHDVQSE